MVETLFATRAVPLLEGMEFGSLLVPKGERRIRGIKRLMYLSDIKGYFQYGPVLMGLISLFLNKGAKLSVSYLLVDSY